MALTVSYNAPSDPERFTRNRAVLFGTVDFDSSYPTGGETLDLSGYFDTVQFVLAEPTSGYVFEYDHTNLKLKAYTAGSEVSNATDLSAVTGVNFMAVGLI